MATKQMQLDETGHRKFGLRDKLAYGAGDFGCNRSFALKGTLTIYWTQFMGVNQVMMAAVLAILTLAPGSADSQQGPSPFFRFFAGGKTSLCPDDATAGAGFPPPGRGLWKTGAKNEPPGFGGSWENAY